MSNDKQINVDDLISILETQRNDALNQLAKMTSYCAKLERELNAKQTEPNNPV